MDAAASSDEKVMAALAHGSVLLMFLGPVVPVIVWASQRKKSKYVSFHALQAMGYQALSFWLWIAVGILVALLSLLLIPLAGALLRDPRAAATIPFLFQVPIFLAIFGWMALSFGIGIVGAVLCLTGRDFRYPILGKWLERYLSYDANPEFQIPEEREDSWVAAICHATAILQLWGVVTPLVVWFSQRERSARLRFQSLQAFVYQAVAFAVYMLGMAVYMVFFLGMFLTLVLGGSMSEGRDLQGAPGLLIVLFFGVMIVFWLVILVLMPIYYLLAGYASLRSIRGHQYRYPLLGKLLEKRMGLPQTPEARS